MHHVEGVASAIGSVITVLVCNPLDLLKTRMQVQSQIIKNPKDRLYNTFFQSFRKVYSMEGIKGFYKGVGLNALILAGSNLISFYTNERIREFLHCTFNMNSHGIGSIILSNFIGGSCGAIINPLYVIRTRVQLQIFHDLINNRPEAQINFFKRLCELIKYEGWSSGFIGIRLNILFCGFCMTMTNGVFELLRYQCSRIMKVKEADVPLKLCFLLGVTGRFASSIFDFPLELVRNRMMDEGMAKMTDKSMLGVCKYLLKKEGIRGFYKGYIITTLRNLPQMGILFIVYEQFRRLLLKQ